MYSKIFMDQVNARLRTLEAEAGTLKAEVGTLKAEVGTLKAEVGTLTADAVTIKDEFDTLTETLHCAVTGFWGLLSERCSPPKPSFSTCRSEHNIFTPPLA